MSEVILDATGQPLPRMPDEIHPSANGVIFNKRGEVLLQRRADNGYWALPGDKVDVGESVEQAVVREVFEETGLLVKVKRLTGIYSDPRHNVVMIRSNDMVSHPVIAAFECEHVSGKLRISVESTEIGYFPSDSLPENTLLHHRLQIQDALVNQVEPFIR